MIKRLYQTEPVIAGGAVVALVQAALALGDAFGLELTHNQVGAILGFCTALLTLGHVIHARWKVTPTSKLQGRESNADHN